MFFPFNGAGSYICRPYIQPVERTSFKHFLRSLEESRSTLLHCNVPWAVFQKMFLSLRPSTRTRLSRSELLSGGRVITFFLAASNQGQRVQVLDCLCALLHIFCQCHAVPLYFIRCISLMKILCCHSAGTWMHYIMRWALWSSLHLQVYFLSWHHEDLVFILSVQYSPPDCNLHFFCFLVS